VHALMPQRVVLHAHCVDTIAFAVRTDCVERVSPRLAGLNWAYVPYARPGLPLALAIAEHRGQRPDVLILGNHGLVVARETVAEAEALLQEVKERLRIEPRTTGDADFAVLTALAAADGGGTLYRLPESEAAHALAMDKTSLAIAARGSLYPDHVIFLGEGSAIAGAGEDVMAVVRRLGFAPASIVFPGVGVLMRADVPSNGDAMARCLADVTARIPADAPLRVLTKEEHRQLTGWDAEKYRQELARKAAKKSA
jgi:rhamnose utilization protein RhaD (predicted bifunctional aldolase and dehydrogenase)